MAGINTNIDAVGGGYGGYGYGYGGYGMGGYDFILGALLGGGIFGYRGYGYDGKDKGCCGGPATCEQVNGVDRDVLQCSNEVDRDVFRSANETQDDICESTNTLKDAINNVGDKVVTGTYALSDKISALAYAQHTTAKDTQTLIEKGNTAIIAAIEKTSLKERNQYLEDQLEKERECKILQKIECLAARTAAM